MCKNYQIINIIFKIFKSSGFHYYYFIIIRQNYFIINDYLLLFINQNYYFIYDFYNFQSKFLKFILNF
jgi:hypothetical protein